jgi:hypothetical protein
VYVVTIIDTETKKKKQNIKKSIIIERHSRGKKLSQHYSDSAAETWVKLYAL